MDKYKITVNQRIINVSADVWEETFKTYGEAEARVRQLEKKNSPAEPNYIIKVLNGIETIA